MPGGKVKKKLSEEEINKRKNSDEAKNKRKEREDRRAALKNEPLNPGDFFETDEEKLIKTYVDSKNKHIKELKKKAETQKVAVEKVSRGKRNKIADIEERDKHIAESEAALKKQNTAIESARFEIESIKKNKKNLISSRKTKSDSEIDYEESKEKASIDIKEAEKAISARKEIIKAVTDKKEQAQQQLQKLNDEKEEKNLNKAKNEAVKDISNNVKDISDEAKTFLLGDLEDTESEEKKENKEEESSKTGEDSKGEESSEETEDKSEKEEKEETKDETEKTKETVEEAKSDQEAAKKEETKPEPMSPEDALKEVKAKELKKIIAAADKVLKEQSIELAKAEGIIKEKQKIIETAEQQKEQAGKNIKSIEEQITKYDELLKQKEEELKKLEEQYNKDTNILDEYKEDQEERKKEKWYQDYITEKNKLDAINSEIASDEEAVASAQSQDGKRFKFKIAGESAKVHTIMVDSMTGEGTTLGQKTSEDEEMIEETKVEEALKSAPVLKDLNKDEIPKYIGYNPKTGEMGGAKKEDGKEGGAAAQEQKEPDMKDEDSKASEEAAVNKILTHKTTEFLDKELKPLVGFAPIQTLTLDLRDNGLEKAHKTVIDIMGKVRDNKIKDTSKAYQIVTLIMTSLDVLMDSGKDDNILAKLEWEGAEALSENFTKQKVYDLILKGLDSAKENRESKEDDDENKETKNKSDIEKATDIVEDNRNNIKDTMKVITKSIDTHKLLGEARAFKGKNDQFARMLEGAYRHQVGDTTAGAVKTGINIAKSLAKTFTGVGEGMLSKGINALASGIGFITGKVAKSITHKIDKSKVLDSPEVLGNVKYDKKKVPDHKFNAILKRVSGITSKDGLYNVVKITDAVTLHSSMKANKEDPIVGRVMGDLGFKNQAEYDKVKVTDILAKTGHPTSDWRGQLKKSMVDKDQTEKKTFWQKAKGFAAKGWKGFKNLFRKDKKTD